MIRRMAEPFRGTVELDDGTVWEERDYLSVAGGTIDQIGLNFRPFHRYGEQPGRFHVLGIHTSPMGFVTQLPRIWRAAPMQPGHTFEATTTSVAHPLAAAAPSATWSTAISTSATGRFTSRSGRACGSSSGPERARSDANSRRRPSVSPSVPCALGAASLPCRLVTACAFRPSSSRASSSASPRPRFLR